jgi:hypothetical protein
LVQAWFLEWAVEEPLKLLDQQGEHPDLVAAIAAIVRIAAVVRTIVAFELIIV